MSYRSKIDACTNLEVSLRFYNDHRPHSAVDDVDPMTTTDVYRVTVALTIN